MRDSRNSDMTGLVEIANRVAIVLALAGLIWIATLLIDAVMAG